MINHSSTLISIFFRLIFFFFPSGASMSLQSFFAKPFKRDFNAYV